METKTKTKSLQIKNKSAAQRKQKTHKTFGPSWVRVVVVVATCCSISLRALFNLDVAFATLLLCCCCCCCHTHEKHTRNTFNNAAHRVRSFAFDRRHSVCVCVCCMWHMWHTHTYHIYTSICNLIYLARPQFYLHKAHSGCAFELPQ